MDNNLAISKKRLLILLFVLLITAVIALYLIYNNSSDINININEKESNLETTNSNNQLTYNGIILEDSTQLLPNNICYATRNNFEITVENCNAQDLDGKDIEQKVTFGYNGVQDRNLSFIFIYEGQLESGSIELKKNVSYYEDVISYENDWISNRVIDFKSYTDLGTPDSRCEMGNTNNTKMYSVILENGYEHTPVIYCFTNQQIVNSSRVLLSGNYDKKITNQILKYKNEFVNVNDEIDFLGNNLLGNGYSFYKVREAKFSQGTEYETHWIFTPKDSAKSGKWNILAYEKEYGLVNSINDDRYLLLDPWWDSNWVRCKNMSIVGGETDLYGFPTYVNLDYDSNMQPDFDDIRFVNASCGNDGTEMPYEIDLKNDSISAGFWINVTELKTGINQFSVYYDNPSATRGSQIGSAVWGNARLVYHFSETSGTTITDSSAQSNNGTCMSGVGFVQGVFGMQLDNNGNKICYSNSVIGISGNSARTIFIYSDLDTISGYNSIYDWGDYATGQRYALNHWNVVGNKWYVDTHGGDSQWGVNDLSRNFFALTYDTANMAQLNINQTHTRQTGGKAFASNLANTNLSIGGNRLMSAFSDGKYDELIIYPQVKSSSWINRTYQNVNSSTYTFGSEQANVFLTVFTFISQTPSDLNTVNSAGGVSIVYNITVDGGILNSSSVGLFWLTNSTILPNQTSWVNGTASHVGFSSVAVSNVSNISDTWYFYIDDNILPATYLLSPAYINNVTHSEGLMETDNSLIKVMVLNMSNRTTYNLLEYNIINETSTSDSLRIYYCNSTYTTGNIVTSPNCANVFNQLASVPYNHTHNLSTHWVAPLTINTTTGRLNNIVITENLGYFIFRGRQTDGWIYRYVPTIARTGGTQTSINLGVGYSELSGTLDYHIHQFSDDTTLNYYVCGSGLDGGIYNCSITRTDLLNLSAIPPSTVNFYSPVAGALYSSSVFINHTASISPVNNSISYYNISLYNSDDTFNQTITSNNSLNLTYNWTNTNIVNGTFNIHVYAIDSAGLYSLSESEDFNITNTFTTTTTVVTSPASPIDYLTASNFSCSNNYNRRTELFINGINKTSQKGLSIVRSAGVYTLNCTSYAEFGYTASSQTTTYTINPLTPTLSVSVSPANVNDYGTETTVNASGCPSQLTCTFYRNGVAVSNPDVQTLSAGTYNYTYSTPGNTNYSSTFSNLTVTINKINPSLSISLSPASVVVNGTATTATGSGCPDSSCTLTRDSVAVTNPEATTLGVGTYVYNYSFAGNTNYSQYSITATLQITPVSFAPNNGTINFTTTNLSQTLQFQVPYNFVTRAYMNLSGTLPLGLNSTKKTNSTTVYNTTSNIYNGSFIVDNNLSTFAYGDGTFPVYTAGGYWVVNYTKNINVTQAVLEIWYSNWFGGGTVYGNFSINETCLINKTTFSIGYYMQSQYLGASCYNGTNWIRYNVGGNSPYPHQAFPDSEGSNAGKLYEANVYFYDNYPTNVNLSIADNQIFYHQGTLSTSNNRTSNFYSAVNDYLDDCAYINNYCVVPITFTSASGGTLSYSDVLIDNYGFVEVNHSYNSSTLQTSIESFTMNLQYDSSEFSLTSATLHYENTIGVGTISSSGFNASVSSSIAIPVNSKTSNQFYWSIVLTNSTGSYTFNSTNQTQNTSSINLYYCNPAQKGNTSLTFLVYDETTLLPLNASIDMNLKYYISDIGNLVFNLSLPSENNSNFSLCISPPTANMRITGPVSYYRNDSDRRDYIFSNALITNSTQTIKLYLATKASTDIVTFTVIDQNNIPVEGAIVQVQKWLLGADEYATLGMFTTDSEGKGFFNLVLYDIWYRQLVYYNGQLYLTTTASKVGSTEIELKISLVGENPYLQYDDITSGISFNNNTGNVIFTWANPTGAVGNGNLKIYKMQANSSSLLSSTSSVSASNSLVYNLNENGTYMAIGCTYLISNYSGVPSCTDALWINIGTPERYLVTGAAGRFISLLLIGFGALLGVALESIVFGLFGIFAALLISSLLGWLNISTWITTLVALLILIAFSLRRRVA